MNIASPKPPLPLSAELISQFAAIVGATHALTGAGDLVTYVTEERNLFQGRSPLVLRPGSTAEVSDICKLASAHNIALVPQGGNTGLVGGQTPHNGEVVVSLRRMDRVREIDLASNTMTCEAGVVLQTGWPDAPRWVSVPCYIALGWVAVFVGPQLMHSAGVAALVLIGAAFLHRGQDESKAPEAPSGVIGHPPTAPSNVDPAR